MIIAVYQLVKNWGPANYDQLGQVTAVAIDSKGDVVIFHRGEVKWDATSYIAGNILKDQSSPIAQATLLHLHKETGRVMHQWGANL